MTNSYIQEKLVELKFNPEQTKFLEEVAEAAYERGRIAIKEK